MPNGEGWLDRSSFQNGSVGVSVMGERGRSHSGMLYWVAYQPRVNRADGRPHAIKVGSVNQSISVQ